MSSKSSIKLKDYLSDDGKLDLSILNLKSVPNVNEIVYYLLLLIPMLLLFFLLNMFSWLYVK